MCKFYLVVILLLSQTYSFAQGFEGKIIVGINASQIDGDFQYGYYKPGLLIGGGVQYMLGDKLSIEPEIYYSQKGARDQVAYNWTLHYIEVPFVFNYQLLKKVSIDAGISVDFILSSRLDNGYNIINQTHLMSKANPCYLVGFEYALSDKIDFNVRYVYSILPINTGIDMSNYFSNNIAISLRYRLGGQANQ